jgi:protein transport protein SEC61 subunit gamma-like protein
MLNKQVSFLYRKAQKVRDNMITMKKISSFLSDVMRILRLSKKPKKDEFFLVAKITGLGILLIGLLGYIVESIRWILGG